MDSNTKATLDEFFITGIRKEYKQGDLVLSTRKPLEYIYYLTQGNVKQSLTTPKGEEVNLSIFKPGSYFPLMLELSGDKGIYDFYSITDSVAYRLPVKKVVEFVKSDREVSFDFAIRLSKGIANLLKKTEVLLSENSYNKIVSLLVYLGDKFGEPKEDWIRIAIPLSHLEIASWLGLQRETVSRNLENMFKEEIVKQEGKTFYIRLSKFKKLN